MQDHIGNKCAIVCFKLMCLSSVNITYCDMVTSYYVVFRITVPVIVYKVYLVLDIMYVLLMVSLNIVLVFYNFGRA